MCGLRWRTGTSRTDPERGTTPVSAVISGCGRYRYRLDRGFGNASPILLWIMLNPSKADARKNDPTIRKVNGFTTRLGYERHRAVNLYAWRATKPRALAAHEVTDPVGPLNDAYLGHAIATADRVIVAWGAHVLPKGLAVSKADRVATLLEIAGPHQKLWCLGTSADGSPRHPLMLPYSTKLEEFTL